MRSAERYERGADGERRTAALLDQLAGYGYVALHDLKWPGRQRANIDHVLVGPSGVYLIDSKNWSGRVVVGQGTLRQNGYRRDQELASCAEAALALVRMLNTDVVPILCLVRDENISGVVQDVHVCTTANVHRLILSRRTILTVEQVQWVVTVLRSGIPPAGTRSQQIDRAARRTSSQTRPAARRHAKPKRSSRPVTKRRGVAWRLMLAAALVVGGYAVVRNASNVDIAGIFDLPESEAVQSAPGTGFGKPQTVTEDGVSVTVTVGKPVNTKPVDWTYASDRSRLVSVPVVIRNASKQKWQPSAPVQWIAEDSLGNHAGGWPVPRDVTTGRRLPAVRAVWPGKPHRGVLVFEVPRGQRLESVSLKTSAFGDPVATWSSTGQ